MFRNRRWAALIALILSFALVAAACGGDDDTDNAGNGTNGGNGGSSASGTLIGAGSSAQAAAMQGWIAGFQNSNSDATVEYDPIGSGGGREQFLSGGSDFAGSDALMSEDEIAQSKDRCAGDQGAIHLPHYISPIAVTFNLDGIDSLNMKPETIAGIFAGEITKWNDSAIADDNPDADLPDQAIAAVHRSDESGTTANFTDYLSAVAPDVWSAGVVETWPSEYGGEGAQGTSGVVQSVTAGTGTIGYADASQIGDLGTVAVGVGDSFVPYTPEAAAKIVDVSEQTQENGQYDYGFTLTRDTTEAGTYPLALVSYHIVCLQYDDQATADLVKAFMHYVNSAEGQQAAADAAGSAPISDDLRQKLDAAVDQISAA